MWWILSGLLVLIVWALEFIFSWPPIFPAIATLVIFVVAAVIAVYKFVQARRAASALEKAIAAQGAQQAANARPERRAEIQALQGQVQGGIAALKTSKLGGKKGGAAALYSLPWYMIIGPPGAGKTTAIKHSGLVFPFQGAGGGAVRGVGGTRNCDWWFTNEAILLDTAGRYATESDDRDEWLAFLAMLRKYRSRQPINGVLVAINIADVIDANELELDAIGKKLRARIDEVMTQLQMVVPVYVLFTKIDLIAGFNEFFGDMRKSDRAQAWGATLKLGLDKSNPGKLFDDEFEGLRTQIHARALKRLASERNREAREKIYQFPLEFAGVKRNLSELIATTFAVNAFQGTPILRGFYFTSGTQEGRPLDRVLGRMGQAMGIRPPETAVPQVVESKSFFLHDVFMNVVFPDGSIAARSASEIRRQRVMRVAISGAAAALAVIVAAPGVSSFLTNRAFLKETLALTKASEAIDWTAHDAPTPKLDELQKLLDRLQEIDGFKVNGLPVGMKWGMYQGDVVDGQAVAEYVKIIQSAMVTPVKQRMEAKLRLVKGDKYLQERTLLKQYLMLSDIDHLDVDPDAEPTEKNDGTEVGAITFAWSEILAPFSTVSEIDLRSKIRPHVRYYLKLLKTKRVAPLPKNDKIVADARAVLQGVPVTKRYYDLFINSLIDEKYIESGDDVRANKKYPPVTLGDLFVDRQDVLKYMKSAQFLAEKRYKTVEGPYCEKGHYRVLRNIKEGAGLLEREEWVVPLTNEEKGERVAVNLRHLAEEYDQRYADQWTDWLLDIRVSSPTTVKDAIDLYNVLSLPEIPYLRIMRTLEDNTQWKDKNKEVFENEEIQRELKVRAQQKMMRYTGGIRIDIDLKKIGEKTSIVPGVFKKTTEFAIPTGNGVDTPLNKYMSKLSALKADLTKAEDQRGPNVDPRLVQDQLDTVLKEAGDLLQGLDEKAKTILTPMLTNPLKIVTTRLPSAGTQTPQSIPGVPKRKTYGGYGRF